MTTHPKATTLAHSASRPAARFWIAYVSAWVPFALVYAALHAAERRGSFADSVPAAVLSVSVAAVCGVVVWLLTGWLRSVTRRWLVIVAHLAAAAAYSLVWIAGISLRILWQSGAEAASAYVASPATGWQLLSGVWLYGVLAGVFHAVRAQRREEDQRRALDAAELRRAHSEASRVSADLRAIRARLDPHFFFNTLQALLPLVRRAPHEAEAALDRFGRMMRYVLDEQNGDGSTTLGAELRFTRDYLALEALRLGHRLRVRERIDRAALDVPLPTLTLQPLVENAVLHGIAPRVAGGTLELRIERIDGAVLISVSDDGPGASLDAVERSHGVGLHAVQERLALVYGGRASLRVTTAPESGFTVSLEVPDDEDSPQVALPRGSEVSYPVSTPAGAPE